MIETKGRIILRLGGSLTELCIFDSNTFKLAIQAMEILAQEYNLTTEVTEIRND